MENKKSFYQSLNIDGYTWAGFWDNLHHFTKKVCNGWNCINCTDMDIKDGNIYDMVKYEVTR